MNIEIVAGKSRGYACAECFRETTKGTDGYHLIVHKTNIPLLSVNEDLHRACGDAIIARGVDARETLGAARVCCHCGKPCAARCAGKSCGMPCCFKGQCIELHDRACREFAESRKP